jgi:hypothetical protein
MQRTAPEETKEQKDREVVRVEANLEELPVFAAAKRARREEVVVWRREGRDPATHKPIDQTITLRPALGVGLPAELERDLYYLVLVPWLERHNFGPKGQIGPIRYQEACAMLGWHRTGPNYRLIRQAVLTLSSLRVEFINAIVDGKTRRLVEHGGGLFSEYDLYAEGPAAVPEKVTRGEFTLRAAPWFQENWLANYRKPIDLTVYRGLRTPLGKALYSYLDKRAFRRGGYVKQVDEDLFVLRDHFRLGVRRTDHLLEEFRRAHDDLRAQWSLLRDARLDKVRPGHYRAVYVFSMQLELLAGESQETKTSRSDGGEPQQPGRGEPLSELEHELTSRGVAAGVARRLVRNHPEERIRRQLDVHDQEAAATKLENPGGRLRLRIEDDWSPFEGYKSPEHRARQDAARRQEAQRRRREDEAQERERARRDALTPEQKAEERLQRWLLVQRATGRPPSSDQIAAKHAEYLQELLAPQNAE